MIYIFRYDGLFKPQGVQSKLVIYGFTTVKPEDSTEPLSGPSQGDAAAGLMKIKGATAAAVA